MKKVSGGKASVYFSYRPKLKADTYFIEEKMGDFAMFQLVSTGKFEREFFKISKQKHGETLKKCSWNMKNHEKTAPVR